MSIRSVKIALGLLVLQLLASLIISIPVESPSTINEKSKISETVDNVLDVLEMVFAPRLYVLDKHGKSSSTSSSSAQLTEAHRNKRCAKAFLQLVKGGSKTGIKEYLIPTITYTTAKVNKAWDRLVSFVQSPGKSKDGLTSTAKPTTRLVPKFDENVIVRKRRAPQIGTAILKTVGKMAGWGLTMTAAGAATSSIDVDIRAAAARKEEMRLLNTRVDCNRHNVGCIQNLCWSNCGPRTFSADWCFVTRNITEHVELAKCTRDSDCQKCWPCGTTCLMEGTNISIDDVTVKKLG